MIRALIRSCGDRFHRFMDKVAPGDPSWASEPSHLDNLDRPTMTFAEYAERARAADALDNPQGEVGDIPVIRNGLTGLTGPHERDDRWRGLTADERRGDGRVA